MSFRSDVAKLADRAGGSFKTREARGLALARLADHLQARNIQIKSIDHLKIRHVERYVAARREAGIGARTIQNELSAIRVTLREAGREKLASQLETAKFGVAGASRDGTKTAISDERLAALRAAALARDEGVAACVDLQRALGLRAEEAVKGCKSLRDWERQLRAGRPVRVIYGTKGKRPRDAYPADRERALAAVLAARAIADRQGGVLVDRPNEKSAMDRYRNVMYAAGFRGENSGHALRYAFAQDQVRAYRAAEYREREAFAQTSLDLGHGDGRGRYVRQVYGRGTPE